MVERESENVAARYARRRAAGVGGRYSMGDAAVLAAVQERQRTLRWLLCKHARVPLDELCVLEVGCGGGGNLLELLRMGVAPENIVANELLPERVAMARRFLPEAITLHEGDATEMQIADATFDIVYQSTVFTSLLDDAFQQKLASCMWRWVRPGGGVLWYDFVFDNPRNPDVRGVPVKRIQFLFPEGRIHTRRVTLAPPISRVVCKVHPGLYSWFNVLPLLRTHVLCWIGKDQ
ncbi:MAG: class I SAM-dependent methyltransferase [Proteobacteria bacterium]|nr:class I SAM-dependent methyltransferase [Pseudomonadota bacterium]